MIHCIIQIAYTNCSENRHIYIHISSAAREVRMRAYLLTPCAQTSGRDAIPLDIGHYVRVRRTVITLKAILRCFCVCWAEVSWLARTNNLVLSTVCKLNSHCSNNTRCVLQSCVVLDECIGRILRAVIIGRALHIRWGICTVKYIHSY